MRIRIANKVAFLAAIGAVTMTLTLAHAPNDTTYASPLRSLTANDFRLVSQQGFGDPQNSWAWSMAWYKNNLYVGTGRVKECVDWFFQHHAAYPPSDPDLSVPCTADAYQLPLAAEVWKFDPSRGTPFTQTNWTRVYQSPYTVPMTDPETNAQIQAPRDWGFRNMAVYTDTDGEQALYVSGVANLLNWPAGPPPSLLRTTDGTNFQAVPADPGTTMGNINHLDNGAACCLRGALGYNGMFYLNVVDAGGAGTVYVSADPRQGDNSFKQFTPTGMKVFELQQFNGHLYLGLASNFGFSVVRLTNDNGCATLPCSAADFTEIIPAGGGLGLAGNQGVLSMHVFTDPWGVPHLYIGDGTSYFGGAELDRINLDDSWDLVVGKPRMVTGPGQCNCYKYPTSVMGAGFNWPFNAHLWRMADYNGVLYVGTLDTSGGFLHGPRLGPLLYPFMGFDLWASADGLTFTPVTINGFGLLFNGGVRTLESTPYGLFVGSANQQKGLRIWLGSLPSGALQLAPQNLQLEASTNRQTNALVWDASSHATLFHIYRSSAAQQTAPPIAGAATSSVDGLAGPGTQLSGPAPRASADSGTRAGTAWLPGQYSEIGVTRARFFVDRHARQGQRYSYYVIAQDAHGDLSAPSNVTGDLVQVPPTTFGDVSTVIANLYKHRHISPAQASAMEKALVAASWQLRAGDARGSYATLDALRRAVISGVDHHRPGPYAEMVAVPLGRLEQRVALVKAHVLASTDVR